MTLVATCEIDSYPLVLGDLLISQQGLVRPHVSVPTRSDLNALLPAEWFRSIEGLERKVGLINDKFAFAWQGTLFAARRIVRDLRDKMGSTQADVDLLANWFLTSRKDFKADCRIIGWLADGAQVSFRCDFLSGDFSSNDHPYLEGTGAHDFRRHLAKGIMETSPAASEFYGAIGKGLGYASNLLGREVAWGRSLQNLYGGGFEVVSQNDGFFSQLDNVAYLFWTVDLENEQPIRLRQIPLIFRYKYVDDILTIESNRPEQLQMEGSGYIARNRLESYIALPVYRDPLPSGSTLEYRLTNPDHMCNFVYVLIPKVGHMYLCVISPNDINRGMMEYRLARGEQEDELELSDRFIPLVFRSIIRRIKDSKAGRLDLS